MTAPSRDVGGAVQPCPLAHSGLDVAVLRADTRAVIRGAVVELAETGARLTIGAAGAVSFEDLAAGSYTARVRDATLDGPGTLSLPGTASARVAAGGRASVEVLLDVALDWLVTSIVVADGEEKAGADGPLPEPDWVIGAIETAAGEESAAADGAPTAVPADDWQIDAVEIAASGADEAPTPPPENATWNIGEIVIAHD